MMEFYKKYNNETVMVDGIKYKVKYSETPHLSISASAEPVNKNNEEYKKIRKQLGDDDWIINLEHSFDLDCQIRERLAKR